jgi:pyrimidine-nucleoside phosphorylase
MKPVEIIKLKRNGHILKKDQIKFFIEGFLQGSIADYQMSAFLMSVFFNGMNEEETFYLTELMLYSGEIVDLSSISLPKIDKHSTGGVGDKISLILAPLVASCDIVVPMISGRGLGHTGGTLDKLESIPGFNVNIGKEDFKRIISETGLAMVGQTSELAPADKKIYALRDVTATIENVSMATASILSKKLAEGADAFVFDVKVGNGANFPDYDQSVKLAKELIDVSKKFGKKSIAVLTDMNEPLGFKIGNWFEVEESIEIMNGKAVEDLLKVNNVLSGVMLFLGNKAITIEEGELIAEDRLKEGSIVYDKFVKMVRMQGGDVNYVSDWDNPKRAKFKKEIIAESDGYVHEMNALQFGKAALILGCGRMKVDENIDYLAGIILNKKCGDKVIKNEKLCEVYSGDEEKLCKAYDIILASISIFEYEPPQRDLIIDILK